MTKRTTTSTGTIEYYTLINPRTIRLDRQEPGAERLYVQCLTFDLESECSEFWERIKTSTL